MLTSAKAMHCLPYRVDFEIIALKPGFATTYFKDAVKSVLRIGSAHNKGGLADFNIAQISHLSNFSDIKL